MRSYRGLAAAGALSVVMGMACGGGDSGSGPPPGNPPIITSVTPTSVSPGDTLSILGSHFSATPGENTIVFSNPVSATTPIWASSTELHVLVDRDATDGPVKVTTSGGTGTSSDGLRVARGVGDVFVFGGTGAAGVLRLPNPTPTTRYLVIPHSVNASLPFTSNYKYKVSATSTTPVAMSGTTAAASAPRADLMSANEWFEMKRWINAGQLVERYGSPRPTRQVPQLSAQAPAATRQFYVLQNADGDQDAASSYKHVTALLRYSGTKCLVYSDIDTLATGNLRQSDFDLFGQTYDTSIEPTNVNYFGPYSDVDGNGKLIMLVSPVVNRLKEPPCAAGLCQCGFFAGFFNPRDLYGSPPVPAGTTNHAEIIYLLAADPGGHWDCSFDVDFTASENLSTIPHEHQHLTSFSYRISHGYPTQVTWLEEGMAHMAEDLNGDNSSNEKRGLRWREDPDSMSIEDNRSPLAQRGAIYMMLRLLADRYGTGILKDILQNKCTGRACIESATGQKFNDLFGEFIAAQYLSGKGITADPRYNYQSINIDDFGTLKMRAVNHPPDGTIVSGSIRRTAASYLTYVGVLGQETLFQFTDVTGAAQLRSVIVRIQ